MASFGVYVPDDSELMEKIAVRAKAEHDGKVSAYARAAIERDIEGRAHASHAMSPTIMVDLTRDLLGKLDAEEMARAVDGLDQRKELKATLADYLAQRSEKPKKAARFSH